MNDKMRWLVIAVHGFLVKLRSDLQRAAKRAPDGRGRRGRRWDLGPLLCNAVWGMLAGMHSLRAVEILTEVAGGGKVGTFGGRRLPDNTLHGLLKVTGEDTVNWLLNRLAHIWHRAKRLAPVHGLEIGGKVPHVLVYDGKQFMQTEVEQPAPYHKKTSTSVRKVGGKKVKTKTYYWAVELVRCVLVSSAAAVCLGLRPVKKGHEVRAVRELDAEMHEEYRWLKKGPVLVLADAKHGNRSFVRQQGDPYGELLDTGHHHYYVLKVKGNAGGLYKEGLRASMRKAATQKPETKTEFENVGHGRRIKREFWRVDTNIARGVLEEDASKLDDGVELAIVSEKHWPNVRQVLLVKQTTIHKQPLRKRKIRTVGKRRKNVSRRPSNKERTSIEWRLAITNIKHDDASARALLNFIRMEWGIEVYHNLLDQVLREDDQEWARQQQAPIALAGLHSVAANILGMLKMRYLRSERNRSALSYPQLVSLIFLVVGGSKVGRILAQNETKPAIELEDPSHGAEVDNEFSKRWSSAQLEQLMTAIQALFQFVLSHFRHLHQVKILLVADIASGTMEMRLNTV
jgi:hypothetical protein